MIVLTETALWIAAMGRIRTPARRREYDRDSNVQVLVIGIVNTVIPGKYTLVYTAQDAAGNQANPATRRSPSAITA